MTFPSDGEPGSPLMGTEVITLGTLVAVCLAVGLAVGSWLDSTFDIAPWGIMLGLFWGLAAACIQSYRLVMRAHERFEREKHRLAGTNQADSPPHP